MKLKQTRLPKTAENVLIPLRVQQRRRTALRLGLSGLFAGSILAIVVMLLMLIGLAEGTSPLLGLWCLPIGAALGTLLGFAWPVHDLRIARALDMAAASDDRFASAIQLVDHRKRRRAELVLEDALVCVEQTPAAAALPYRAPREIRWLPLPVLILAALCWIAPKSGEAASVEPKPEVSAEEWALVAESLRDEIRDLPEPTSDEEKETDKELEELASLLDKKPTKKEALAKITKLRFKLEEQQRELKAPDVDMRKAAKALQQSKLTKKIAELLNEGEYQNAADELKALAEKLKAGQLQLSAEEYESLASSFEQTALELASHEELKQACQQCANACNSLNREQLAEAMKRFSECLCKARKDLKKCDSCRRRMGLLDRIRSRISRCGRCQGNRRGLVRCSGPGCKNGREPGWGTASNWEGGRIDERSDQRMPTLTDTPEGPGMSTATPTISAEERADSAQAYRETYAEMIRKAEADLGLEDVPFAYREYLRRYFNAIKPDETSDREDGENE